MNILSPEMIGSAALTPYSVTQRTRHASFPFSGLTATYDCADPMTTIGSAAPATGTGVEYPGFFDADFHAIFPLSFSTANPASPTFRTMRFLCTYGAPVKPQSGIGMRVSFWIFFSQRIFPVAASKQNK